jgi:hypothetical protein
MTVSAKTVAKVSAAYAGVKETATLTLTRR